MERVHAARWARLSLRRGHADDVPWNSRPRNLCKTRITVATHLQNVDGGFAATGVDALSLKRSSASPRVSVFAAIPQPGRASATSVGGL